MRLARTERRCRVAGMGAVLATATLAAPAQDVSAKPDDARLFVPAYDAIPVDDSRRRKWDAPVIVDLDQDGLQDVVLTEHGRSVVVHWNEGEGRFSEAHRLAGGDLHGISAADFDRDGVMDIVIAQGGGDGANPRRPLWLRMDRNRTIVSRTAFDYFEKGRGRAVKFLDADSNGLLDLVVTGFPTPDQKDGANHLYTNVTEEKLVFSGNLPQAKWLGYRLVTVDIDNDGRTELLFFGGADMTLAGLGPNGAYVDRTREVLGGLADTSDVHNVAVIDFDNDGDMDLFLTRAEHQFDLESYYDPDARNFAFLTFRKAFSHQAKTDKDTLVLENLQRTYPHYDIHLGAERTKFTEVPDRHAGRDLEISAEDAMGWPDGPTEEGLYIGYLGDGLWRIGGQSRSRLAGVLRNVDIVETIEPQPTLPAKLFENRDGSFVDVTDQMGIDIRDQTTSAAVGDFDNDGWSDLAVLHYGDMARVNTHSVYMNEGGKGFVRADNHGVAGTILGTTGGSIEAWDYDSDGAVELVFSEERGRWHVLENRIANLGNFAIARVGSSPSGQALPAGAVLTATACGQVYRRIVGAGSAAFSQSLNSEIHVGVGACSEFDSAQVRWTNGETASFEFKLNEITAIGGAQ